VLKIFYILSAVLNFANGLWMLLFPASWYHNFPAAIPHTGPFNSHFIMDLGVAYLLVGLVFGWCSVNINRSRLSHLAVTAFFVGHALIHLADLLTGRLPSSHWQIDTPLVFAPTVLLIALAVPSVRNRLGADE
jgi:hypothetical protein